LNPGWPRLRSGRETCPEVRQGFCLLPSTLRVQHSRRLHGGRDCTCLRRATRSRRGAHRVRRFARAAWHAVLFRGGCRPGRPTGTQGRATARRRAVPHRARPLHDGRTSAGLAGPAAGDSDVCRLVCSSRTRTADGLGRLETGRNSICGNRTTIAHGIPRAPRPGRRWRRWRPREPVAGAATRTRQSPVGDACSGRIGQTGVADSTTRRDEAARTASCASTRSAAACARTACRARADCTGRRVGPRATT
jgi:hypothetical protein